MAGDARYAAFSAFLYIAILGLGFSVYNHARDRAFATRMAPPVAIACVVLLLTLWIITFRKERRFLRDWTRIRNHSLLVLRWAEAIPQNPEIASLSPYPETPGIIHILAEHDAFRPRLIGKKMAAVVTETSNSEREFAGNLEQTTPDASGQLLLKGAFAGRINIAALIVLSSASKPQVMPGSRSASWKPRPAIDFPW